MQKIAIMKAEPKEESAEALRFHGFYFLLFVEKLGVGILRYHGYCPEFEIVESSSRESQEGAIVDIFSRLLEGVALRVGCAIVEGDPDELYSNVDYSAYCLAEEETAEIKREFADNANFFRSLHGASPRGVPYLPLDLNCRWFASPSLKSA